MCFLKSERVFKINLTPEIKLRFYICYTRQISASTLLAVSISRLDIIYLLSNITTEAKRNYKIEYSAMRRFMEDKSPENSKQTENKFQLENVDFELLNKQGNEWKHENTATEIRSTSDGIYKCLPLTIKWIMDCWTCKFHPHHQPQCQWWQQEITLHNARSIASFKYFHIPKKLWTFKFQIVALSSISQLIWVPQN